MFLSLLRDDSEPTGTDAHGHMSWGGQCGGLHAAFSEPSGAVYIRGTPTRLWYFHSQVIHGEEEEGKNRSLICILLLAVMP